MLWVIYAKVRIYHYTFLFFTTGIIVPSLKREADRRTVGQADRERGRERERERGWGGGERERYEKKEKE
jgi:hypothetical protein